MNLDDILKDFKAGKLSPEAATEKLRELRAAARAPAAPPVQEIPLTEGQKGLWTLQKLAPGMSAYNLPIAFAIDAEVDVARLREAVHRVVAATPTLTSVVVLRDGTPILSPKRWELGDVVTDEESALEGDALVAELRRRAQRPFSLESGPLVRVNIFRRPDRTCVVLVTVHHVVFDGSSMLPFLQVLGDTYVALVEGRSPALEPASAEPYLELVAREQALLAGDEAAAHRAYWMAQLAPPLGVLELPTDFPRPPTPSFSGQTLMRELDPALAARVSALAEAESVNVSVVFAAAFNMLLRAYTGADDVTVGVPTMMRPDASHDALIGYFVNMVAIRSRGFGARPFAEVLRELQVTLADALDHAAYPFPAVVRDLKLARDASAAPVFNTLFAYQNFLRAGGVDRFARQWQDRFPIAILPEVQQEGEYELGLEVYQVGDRTSLRFKFDPELFAPETIARMADHYASLLARVAADPSRPCDAYGAPSEADERTLRAWNATEAPFPGDVCIHELFERQAAATPDAVALVFGDRQMTYRDLDARSSVVGRFLRTKGVGPGRLVGLCVERSFEMIIGLLGILKAGGAYVPLDPEYPADRLAYMLEDAAAAVVLTQSALAACLPASGAHTYTAYALDGDWAAIEREARLAPAHAIPPSARDLVYVLYTSGSTGKPKGVMLEHRALVNRIVWGVGRYGFTPDDRILQKTSFCFDVSGWEFYCPLVSGARLVLLPPGKHKDAAYLRDFLQREAITMVHFVPSMLAAFLQIDGIERCTTLRHVFCSGEALTPAQKDLFFARLPGPRIHNLYGPTEAAIEVTAWECERGARIVPIGAALPNVQLYVLDGRGQRCPIGVPGELCLAGVQLARGYWNKPELTRERFVDNPFTPGTKLYRTGDLARFLADGNVEYLGRLDNQVKIRGFRIELGEIESELGRHPDVQEAVVVAKEVDGSKKLIAYLTRAPESGRGELDPSALRDRLKASLPEYMVPSSFVTLDAMPLTPAGKADRRALTARPLEARRARAGERAEAVGDAEEAILSMWRTLLRRDDIGVTDHFFDAGGDSILGVVLAERISRRFGCEFGVTQLFTHTSVRAIAAHVVTRAAVPVAPVAPAAVESPVDGDAYRDCLAIIGMSCHFPGAKTHQEFWRNLRGGVESIRFFTERELDEQGVPGTTRQRAGYVAVNSALDGKECFDPGFFGISARDAELMDPQFRQLLQHAWRAFEDAGYVPETCPQTAVFMSASNGFYQSLLERTADSKVLADSTEYVKWILGQGGTIPTMVSHKLGLTGPSFFVHSNCSSSLSALYAAFQCLRAGDARLALVGASTILPESAHGYLHQPGLNFSSDGHLRAFDAAADGMVAGEGVGVILVKNARDAIADGDNIHCLVRAVGLNNDGAEKAGYYAPSVRGQAEVIASTLAASGVDPATIGYLEAHGTGTKLGDPIEIAALREAHRGGAPGACAIGSVKTNIGHLDTAAGIAGCIKVALGLRHREIPPSLHFRELNPNIDLKGSPFYIVTAHTPWPSNGGPARAALSSFGLGGTNAHAIFEAYDAGREVTRAIAEGAPVLVPVSARSEEQLRRYVALLRDFVRAPDTHVALDDLAYTLQVGRKVFEHRVAFVVRSLDEFVEKSGRYLDGDRTIDDASTGGGSLTRGRRVSLPTYPFAEDRFGLPSSFAARASSAARLHPLVHANTSTLSEQRFTSTFDGTEPFLADHVIGGERVLPAVAYLEMARAAVLASLGGGGDEDPGAGLRLKNVVWSRPFVAGDAPRPLHVELAVDDGDTVRFAVFSGGSGETERVLHSEGIARFEAPSQEARIDVEALRSRCGRTFSADACYAAFTSAGVAYGLAHRGIAALHRAEGEVLARLAPAPGVRGQAQPGFVLHPSVADAALQAAIGLVMGEGASSPAPSIPFALDELEILAPSDGAAWAYVRLASGAKPGSAITKLDVDVLDEGGAVLARLRGLSSRAYARTSAAGVDDARGVLRIAPRWTVRAARPVAIAYDRRVRLLCPVASDPAEGFVRMATELLAELRAALADKAAARALVQIVVPLSGDERADDARDPANVYFGLAGLLKSARLESSKLAGQVIGVPTQAIARGELDAILDANAGSPDDVEIRYANGERLVLERHAMESDAPAGPVWKDGGVYLVTGGAGAIGYHVARAIAARTAQATLVLMGRTPLDAAKQRRIDALEALGAKVIYRVADAGDPAFEAVVRALCAELGTLDGVIHAAGIVEDRHLWNKDSESLARVLRPKVAGLVALDRATRDRALDVFAAFSSGVGMIGNAGQGDYAAANAFMDHFAAHRSALVRRGERHGITLSIGWPLWLDGGMKIEPARVAAMERAVGMLPMPSEIGVEELDRALASGASHVVVTYGELARLRAALLPSSAEPAASHASPHARAVEEAVVAEVARALQVTPDAIELDVDPAELGLDPLIASQVIAALDAEHGLASTLQTLTAHRSLRAFAASLAERVAPALPPPAPPAPPPASLEALAVDYFKRLLASSLKVRPADLDASLPLERYGIDSIMAVDLTNRLEEVFGSLPKTLFYEYQNIADLTAHFLDAHRDALVALLGSAPKPASLAPSTPRAASSRAERALRARKTLHPGAEPARAAAGPLDVAIIGLAGKYPQAADLDAFWENLRAGRDCITEVPASRWDHAPYFDPDKNAIGKTYTKWGGFLDGVDQFDSLFFNISPIEARVLDPQERLFLQCAYAAFEDAGYTRDRLQKLEAARVSGAVGVYVGVMYEEYQLYGAVEQARGNNVALSGSASSIANRVSYFFNLHGPSMAVDTMCSASLTAIHLACQSLRLGECAMAIAGGVNVSVHPNKYLMLAQGRYASSVGRCGSFGEGGDGYVPGEGVGAVVLKPLERALEAGDRIYAVIKGSAVNHGGKTNGYSVPNPNAQANAVARAIEESGVDVRHVGYVEAHGTGTSLGDPIEIAGLGKAFAPHLADAGEGAGGASKQFCAIGSVKSNIGHCESAAGVAGLTKVLLQMQHGELVPSLHSKVLNPYIDFASSAFAVQRELAPWPRLRTGDGEERPRVAGVSSFGAGGSNAHLVVAEWIPPSRTAHRAARSAIVVLSAKDEERLLERARDLSAALAHPRRAALEFLDVVYTLQTGREALEQRLALVVSSLDELAEELRRFVEADGRVEASPRMVAGRARRGAAPGEGELEAWLAARDLARIAASWVDGASIDWARLSAALGETGVPRVVSLPAYPFARESHWVLRAENAAGEVAHLHPLLHANTSNLEESRFRTVLSGDELFLRDHVVRGQRVLPAVAYLEMARAAIEHGTRGLVAVGARVKLENVLWARPVVAAGAPIALRVRLGAAGEDRIAFDIRDDGADPGDPSASHCRGRAELLGDEGPRARIDLVSLREAYGARALDVARCYASLEASGIAYGPAHRALQALYAAPEGERALLARIALPEAASKNAHAFTVHPSTADAALQAMAGFALLAEPADPSDARTRIPFAVDEVEIFGETPREAWAWLKLRPGRGAGAVDKMDVDLCDGDGVIALRMRGISARAVVERTEAPAAESEATLLVPVWEPARPEPFAARSAARTIVAGSDRAAVEACCRSLADASPLVIDGGAGVDELRDYLRTVAPVGHVVWLADDAPPVSMSNESILAGQRTGALAAFRLIKALLAEGYGAASLEWSVVTAQAVATHPREAADPTHASLHGLFGSAAKELPSWTIRLVDLERGWNADGVTLASLGVFAIAPDAAGRPWARRGAQWLREKLVTYAAPEPSAHAYRRGGVYVVIGGAGGIGRIWSEHLASTYGAQLVWIGRRAPDADIEEAQRTVGQHGPTPLYIQADATDRASLERARATVRARFGAVHGVVHSAIVLADRSLANMDEERFASALAAKADVSVRIAQVFAGSPDEPLDFVLFFSSLTSFLAPAGQSNYASGSTFEDAFAQRLALEWPCLVKVVDWGYWGSVGIVASDAHRARMRQIGIGSIEPPEAWRALDALLASPVPRLALLKAALEIPGIERGASIELVRASTPLGALDLGARWERAGLGPSAAEIAQLHADAARDIPEIEALLAKLLASQLEALGGGADPAARIAPVYGKWLEESRAILRAHGILDPDVSRAGDAEALWRQWDARKVEWTRDENKRALVQVVEITTRALPAVLSGARPATEILFPKASMLLLEGLYRKNAVADFFNERVASFAAWYARELGAAAPSSGLRVLEIGAGTGGTSAGMLTALRAQGNIAEYMYTDLSRAFLLHAEKTFGPENPFLRYGIFDVESAPGPQGVAEGSYDLVIAANVLHATKDMRRTLRHAKRLLKRGGVLLVNELERNSIFSHLIFGLLEGWWLYVDPELRIPGSPALAPATWRALLEAEGFAPVLFPAQAGHRLGSQIIAAASNGLVRGHAVAPVSESRPETLPTMPTATAPSKEKSTAFVKRIVGEALRIPSHKLDASEPLENYGLDSILVGQLTSALGAALGGDVDSTMFFEHRTIDALTAHLLATRGEDLRRAAGVELHAPAAGVPTASAPVPSQMPVRLALTSPRAHEPAPPALERAIAVIGVAGRYPMARDLVQFWENLKNGRNCISEVPEDRWSWRDYFHDERGHRGATYTKWGGFLEGAAEFDPLFFRISPAEAERLDPQERLFLLTAYACIEDAGHTPASLSPTRKVGVFCGVMNGNYATGASYWSIPNRVSYSLDLHGPSVAVDSACSSSLTALHLAIDSLVSGSSDCAIVGGVNVIVHPEHYVKLSAAAMLSSGDACRSFGDGADGFVDAEGVGAVLLKPLARAQADGDTIYGIIRGSALNAGGRTSGYTVPNPAAQAKVVADAIANAGVDPRDVSYIEAHGTGTSLGDPIEIAGLTRAFEARTPDRQFCAIGSVKSNIGHCESAAGIAALTKVLLQLRHGMLVPSLHARAVNPKIDFAKTPFFVQHELGEWKRAGDRPRIAGISSFGAGGANAHVILEEYIEPVEDAGLATDAPALVLLSAVNPERLRVKAAELSQWLRGDRRGARLADVAYTLQVGREAMDARLGLQVASFDELDAKLEALAKLPSLADHGAIEACYFAEAEANRGALSALAADEDMEGTLRSWMAKGKFGKLLDLWCRGLDIDWAPLHAGRRPKRVPLPTYPFERRRHWLAPRPSLLAIPVGARALAAPVEPPGVHHATLTGDEPFLRDHRVGGEPLLPAVAYLEMARAASGLPLPLKLTQVAWVRPLVCNGAARVVIDHVAGAKGTTFRVSSPGEDGTLVVHSEGKSAPSAPGASAPVLDLGAIRARCTTGTITGDACRRVYADMGIAYGPAFHAVESIAHGAGDAGPEALAVLKLPRAAGEACAPYVLHPSLADGALQAVIGVLLAPGEGARGASLPFALDEIEIFDACTESMHAWIRLGAGTSRAVTKLDVDLCDDRGVVRARFKGLCARAVKSKAAAEPARTEARLVTLLPVWEAVARPRIDGAAPPRVAEPVLLAGNAGAHASLLGPRFARAVQLAEGATEQEMAACLSAAAAAGTDLARVIFVARSEDAGAADDALVRAQERGVIALFRLVKALLRAGYGGKALALSVVTTRALLVREGDPFDPSGASLHGFAGALAKEHPRWSVRVVDVLDAADLPAALDDARLPGDASGSAWALRSGEWLRAKLVPMEDAQPVAHDPPYKRGGTYVVLGGAGGLGRVWTEHVVRHYGAQVVWIGRRPLDAEITRSLDAIAELGPRPRYLAVDATDREALRAARESVRAEVPCIDGIVHSAIVLQDRAVASMDEACLRSVLAAKIDASVRMVQVFQEDLERREKPLDFVLFFSSMNAFAKSAGQANYSAGCTFKDAFAAKLAQEARASGRATAVKVVDWGYWGSVGAVASDAYRARMEKAGVLSIEPAEAMLRLDRFMGEPFERIALVKGSSEGAKRAESAAGLDARERIVAYGAAAPSIVPSVAPVLESAAGEDEAFDAFVEGELSHFGELEAVLGRVLAGQMHELGLLVPARPGAPVDFAQIDTNRARAGVRDAFRPWLVESVAALDRHGLLAGDPSAAGEWKAEWEARKKKWCADPNRRALMVLLAKMVAALPAILTGRTPATDIMFPKGSMSLVEGIYKNNPSADRYNALLADFVAAFVRERRKIDPGAPLRIFEIGAGTGGTSLPVLERLHAESLQLDEYGYSDLSRAFLNHAERSYKPRHPHLRTALFDVDRDVAGQGLEPASYDLVIAANVLHATRDVRVALRNAKALLRPNGVLVLNELTGNALFNHLTFGLLEGWWLYEDAPLRVPGSPAIAPETWTRLLEGEGFHRVVVSSAKSRALGQAIVAAESDGVVRQSVRAPEAPEPVAPAPAAPLTADALHPHAVAYLKSVIGGALKLSVQDLQASQSLDRYGLDSIMVLDINNALEPDFPGLSKTLFFEHGTIDELASYFVREHASRLAALLGLEPPPPPPEPPPTKSNGANRHATNGHALDDTIAYVRTIFGETLQIAPAELDIHRGIDHYGVDSIVVLDLNKKLEERFDNLSKTLFFEHNTIASLAHHLAEQYAPAAPVPVAEPPHPALDTRHAPDPDPMAVPSDDVADTAISIDDLLDLPGAELTMPAEPPRAMDASAPAPRLVVHQDELATHPEVAAIVAAIDAKSPPIGYERVLFPYYLLSSDRSSYVRVIIDEAKKLLIPYLNMAPGAYSDFMAFARERGLTPLIVDYHRDWMDDPESRWIPLGVAQHLGIEGFGLQGGKMRKLRYLVDKFRNGGRVRVDELTAGSEMPLAQMRDLMVRWSEGKKNVIRHSYSCMDDLLHGRLHEGHRAFFTYQNDVLCSIILMEAGDGGAYYVMDQEFYDPRSAPLGHMEYAIAQIIAKLRDEGSKVFSLGITWYPFAFEDHPKIDPEGYAWLKEQHAKKTLLHRIFEQGASNYQFKKKFGEAGEPIFARLPKSAPMSLVLDYWPVFYQNSIPAARVAETLAAFQEASDVLSSDAGELSAEQRAAILRDPQSLAQLDYGASPLDLMTDTWSSVKSAAVLTRAAHLRSRPRAATEDAIRRVFPFEHLILTEKGQIAEELFYRTFAGASGARRAILGVVPWRTTLLHQLENGFEVIELPSPEALDPASSDPFRGEIDRAALERELGARGDSVACVGIELLGNAVGGHGVRPSHLAMLRTAANAHGVPLVLDASRIVTNARLVHGLDPASAGRDVWDIVTETARAGHHVVTSLTKDFAVPVGGLVATDDGVLAAEVRRLQAERGKVLAVESQHMIFEAFADPAAILELLGRRCAFVERVGAALMDMGVPVLGPARGHAVLIDAAAYAAEGATNTEKKGQLLIDLFRDVGVRGGMHQAGRQRGTILDRGVRLAFPLGLTPHDEGKILDALQRFFAARAVRRAS